MFRPARLRVVESRFVLARQATVSGGVLPRRRTIRPTVKRSAVVRKRRTILTKVPAPPAVGLVRPRRVRKAVAPVRLRVVESRYTLHKAEAQAPAGVGHLWRRRRRPQPKKVNARQHRRMFSHGTARVVFVLSRVIGTADVRGLKQSRLPRPRVRRPVLTKFTAPPPTVGFVHRRRPGKIRPASIRVVESRYTLHKAETGPAPTPAFPWFRKRRRLWPRRPPARSHRRLFQHGRSFVTFVLSRMAGVQTPRDQAVRPRPSGRRRRVTLTKFTAAPPVVGFAWPRRAKKKQLRLRRTADVRRNVVLTKATPPPAGGTFFSRERARVRGSRPPTKKGSRRSAAVFTKVAPPPTKSRPPRRPRRGVPRRVHVTPTRRGYVLTKFFPPFGPARMVPRKRPPRFRKIARVRPRRRFVLVRFDPSAGTSGEVLWRTYWSLYRQWQRRAGERTLQRYEWVAIRRWQRQVEFQRQTFERGVGARNRVWMWDTTMNMPVEKRYKTKGEAVTFGADFSTFGQVIAGETLGSPTVTFPGSPGSAPAISGVAVNTTLFYDAKGGRNIPANKGVLAKLTGGSPGEYPILFRCQVSPSLDFIEVPGILIVTEE